MATSTRSRGPRRLLTGLSGVLASVAALRHLMLARYERLHPDLVEPPD